MAPKRPNPAGDDQANSQPRSRKRARRERALRFVQEKGDTILPSLTQERPFSTDASDHCETPFAAFRDVEPFLFWLARGMKKKKEDLKIYDPYFAEGTCTKHLSRLGFLQVYNKNEDFYRVLASGATPLHDVVVTNPPFSGDHIERIMDFCVNTNGGRPWLLLLPAFVCKKKTFAPLIGSRGTLFLLPAKKYSFWSPGRSFVTGPGKQSSEEDGKATAPFECMWFIWLGQALQSGAREWWTKKYQGPSGCFLTDDVKSLPDRVFPPRTEKRPNPKMRQRLRKKGIILGNG